jgi:hypothetical protein
MLALERRPLRLRSRRRRRSVVDSVLKDIFGRAEAHMNSAAVHTKCARHKCIAAIPAVSEADPHRADRCNHSNRKDIEWLAVVNAERCLRLLFAMRMTAKPLPRE